MNTAYIPGPGDRATWHHDPADAIDVPEEITPECPNCGSESLAYSNHWYGHAKTHITVVVCRACGNVEIEDDENA